METPLRYISLAFIPPQIKDYGVGIPAELVKKWKSAEIRSLIVDIKLKYPDRPSGAIEQIKEVDPTTVIKWVRAIGIHLPNASQPDSIPARNTIPPELCNA